ncbi:MAG: efflux RND transporter periplasmic adaptor subunit [Opitutaceae bacterium]|nr:efflux RND transporter periplasmic adaptor subunit [Opitutaceae bacterium]
MPTRTLLPLVLALILSACSKHETPRLVSDAMQVPKGIELAEVRQERGEVEVFGTVRSVQRASLAFRLMGNVNSVAAGLGTQVAAGDVLATLHSADLEAKLAQASAALNTAQRDAARERVLAEKGASTAESVRALEDRLMVAQASVRELEAMLSFATLRAPLSGRIASRSVEPGDFVGAGQVVFKLEAGDRLEIEAPIPLSLASSLATGGELRVVIDGATLTATLRELSAGADAVSRTLSIKADLPAGTQATPGTFARIRLQAAGTERLLVPASALERVGQLDRVLVVGQEGTVSRRLVKTGLAHDGQVEVLAGLRVGERIVRNAAAFGRIGGEKLQQTAQP